MKTIFETIHGSHLYGLAHAGSDVDTYRVILDKVKNKHTISGDQDVTVVSLDKFLLQAGKGNPQALEAMFSPIPSLDEISALRSAFRPNLAETIHTYSRTIRNFSHGDRKQQRHALRLAINVNDLYKYGYFNPMLPSYLADSISLDFLMEPAMLVKMATYMGRIDFEHN